MIDYGLIFVTGVLTSLHCVGMCGAIVLAYATTSVHHDGASALNYNPIVLHAAYNVGRVFSYALLGALVAMAGATISGLAQVGDIIAIVSGVIMIVAGLAMFGLLPLPTTVSLGSGSLGIAKVHGKLIREKSFLSKFSLGFLTPLLPCGLLYAMLAKAAASGSMLNGALTMGVFGIGMAPSLMLLGSVSSFFSVRMRKGAEMIGAATIILMGIVLVLRGLHVPFLGFIPVGNVGGEKHSCCSE